MWGVILTSPNQSVRIADIDLVPSGSGEVRVKIAAAGACHSALHVRRGEWNLSVPLVMGLIWGTLNGFGMLATTLTIEAIVVYSLGNVALPFFYHREHRPGFSVTRHVPLPILALGLLGYVLYRTVWPIPAYPFNIPGYVSIGWVVLGFGFVAWISRRSPEVLGRSGLVFTTYGEGR
jgi:hypothetical protein